MICLRWVARIAVAAVLVAACGSHSEPGPSPASRDTSADAATQPAAARTVPGHLRFIAKTLDGQDFHGQSLLGKRAVLWFWAPWCPICRSEPPVFGQVAASHRAVTFVGVAGLGQLRAMKEFVDKYPVKGFTQLADADGTVWAKFGITEQPAFAFIRPDGSIDIVKCGLSEPDLRHRVTDLAGQ